MVTHILTPRATNHAQVTDDDLQILHCIKSGLKINWISIIAEVMKKAKRSTTYKLPYALLISRFMDHFGITVEGEVTDYTTTDSEIGAKHLGKMGLKENSDGKWVMATELEEEGEEASAPVPASAPATMPSSSAAFEKVVMEKLDHILRNQMELSSQVRGVEDRVASLEKKLVFVDLGMEDPTESAHEASPTHEPTPAPIPEVVPQTEPVSESVPIPEAVPEVTPQSEPEPMSFPEPMAAEFETVSKSPIKCYIRKPKPPVIPEPVSAPAESSLPGPVPAASPKPVHMSSPSLSEFTDRESSESPHLSSSSIDLQAEKEKYIFKRIEKPIVLLPPDSIDVPTTESVSSPTLRVNPVVKESMKRLVSEMTFSMRTAQYSESEINASVMNIVQELKGNAEEEKSPEVATAEALKAAPSKGEEKKEEKSEAKASAMETDEVGTVSSSSSDSVQQEDSISEVNSEENRISDSPDEESTADDMSE